MAGAAAKKSVSAEATKQEVAINFSKATSALESVLVNVTKNVEGLEDKLSGLSEKIASKEIELSELVAAKQSEIKSLELEFTEKKRAMSVQFVLDMKEDKEKVIFEALAVNNQVAIDDDVLTELQSKVNEFPSILKSAEDTAAGRAKGIAESAAKKEIELLNANFKAQEATNIAKIANLEQQVILYKEQSAMLLKQLDSQREAEVAKSKNQPVIQVSGSDASGSRR